MIKVENFKLNNYNLNFGSSSAKTKKQPVQRNNVDKPAVHKTSDAAIVMGLLSTLALAVSGIMLYKNSKNPAAKVLKEHIKTNTSTVEAKLKDFVPAFSEAADKKISSLSNGRVKAVYTGKNEDGREFTDCLVFGKDQNLLFRFLKEENKDTGSRFIRVYKGDEKLLGKIEDLPDGEFDSKYLKKMYTESEFVEFDVENSDLKRYQKYIEVLNSDGKMTKRYNYYNDDKTMINHNTDKSDFYEVNA